MVLFLWVMLLNFLYLVDLLFSCNFRCLSLDQVFTLNALSTKVMRLYIFLPITLINLKYTSFFHSSNCLFNWLISIIIVLVFFTSFYLWFCLTFLSLFKYRYLFFFFSLAILSSIFLYVFPDNSSNLCESDLLPFKHFGSLCYYWVFWFIK